MKYDEFFRKHPVFTREELGNHLLSLGQVRPRTLEAILAHYIRTGRLVRVRRGLYAVIPVGARADFYPVDPFLIAAKLAPDAALSHHTALEYLGNAYSTQEFFTYSAACPIGQFAFRSYVFRGTRFPQALLRRGQQFFGIDLADRAGMDVRVTCFERTLVDVLDRPELTGSWEEIWRSLESIEYFDLDKVVEYAHLLNNATTAAKVGFYLEQHREPLMVEEQYLQQLQAMRPRQPHYLERSRRQAGRLISRWNLVVPEDLLERSWEEVL